jgi:hypothetical protein
MYHVELTPKSYELIFCVYTLHWKTVGKIFYTFMDGRNDGEWARRKWAEITTPKSYVLIFVVYIRNLFHAGSWEEHKIFKIGLQ